MVNQAAQLCAETVLNYWQAEKIMHLAHERGIDYNAVRAIVEYCSAIGPRCYDYAYKWIAIGATPPRAGGVS